MHDHTDRGVRGHNHTSGHTSEHTSGPTSELAGMRAAIHAHDWSQTSLGPMHSWPSSLATCVEVMLASPARMTIYWGPDHVLLYNDGAAALLGDKHPAALGRPARAVLHEIWDQLGPIFAAVFASGESVEDRSRLLPINRSGQIEDAWFDYTLSPIPGADGSIGGLLNITCEVTDKIQAEAKLRQANETLQRRVEERTERLRRSEQDLRDSERDFQRILERLPVGIGIADSHGQSLALNPAALRLHGFESPAEMLVPLADYRVAFELREPDGATIPAEQWPLARAMRGDYVRDYEVVLRRYHQGEERIVSYSAVPVAMDQDGTHRIVFVMHDVTEQRRFHHALADNEARLRALFETVIDAILTIDERGRIDSANPAVARLFGYTAAELRGQNVRVLMPKFHRDAHDGYLERYRHTGERRIIGVGRELVGRRKDGTTFPLELSVTELRVGGKRMFTGVMRDITARKQAERAERESRRRLELVSDNVPAMISYIDRDEIFRFNNARYQEWFGHEDMFGATMREVLGDSIYEQRAPYVRRVLSGETVRFEGPVYHRQLGLRDTELAYVPDLGEQGEVRGFYALVFDITERKRGERALKESEEKFRSAFQTAPIVLVVSSLADGRWTEVNDTFEQLMGYSREEVLGRTSLEVGMWDEPALRREFADQLATQGFLDNLEVTPRTKSGALKTMLLSARIIHVDGVPYALSAWIDITERRQAEQDLRRAHGLIQGVTHGTQDMIAALDGDYRLLFFNEAYRQEYNQLWDADLQLGASILEAMAPWPEERRKARELWARALEGESFIILEQFGPTDEKQTYELRFNPVNDAQGELVGAAHILRDVTEQIRTQQALRVANEQLKEVAQRKDDYLAMLGHELRNPLAAICSATELLELRKTEDLRRHRAIAVLERQSNHMVRLIDGLLEVSRIARGKIDLELRTLDLRELVTRVLEDRQDEFDARRLELQTQIPPTPIWTSGDPVRLTQIFDNLVGNALKFTQAPGLVTVTVHAHGGDAVCSVRDTGIGIRPEMISTIFEPFQQESQSIARMAGGLGLGLALAKGLVELHQGTIQASSAGLDAGAEFEVRLPLASAPLHVPGPEPAGDPKPRRILIVEDNLDAAQMLREVLELFGHQVTAVDTGERGLDVVKNHAIDLVLCDLGLPGISGYEFARAVRAHPPSRRLALVALSGYAQAEDRRQTAAAGFDEHLVKPVNIATLEQTLRRFEELPYQE